MAMEKAVQNKLTKCVKCEAAPHQTLYLLCITGCKSRLSRSLRDGNNVLALNN